MDVSQPYLFSLSVFRVHFNNEERSEELFPGAIEGAERE